MLSFALAAVQADFAGATVTGQVAVGERIVQVQHSPGAIVNYVEAEQRPVPRLRPPPVRRPPRDFRELLGRDKQLDEIGQALAGESAIEIHGEPGMGKSVLLRHFANRTVKADAALVHAACLGRPSEDVLQLLFESMYEWDGGAVVVATPAELARYLGDQQAIVVLDDAELTPDELAQLRDVARCATFVWSRSAQALLGEGRSIALGGLGPEDAVALLERGAGRELEDGERAAAEELCRALAGHPLRVLQAGALMRERATGPAGVLDLVDSDAHTVTPALVASLPPAQANLLETLAAARGQAVPADLLAAIPGSGDVVGSLVDLEKRSLALSHSPSYSFAGELPPAGAGAGGSAGTRLVKILVRRLAGAGALASPAKDHAPDLSVATALLENPPPDVGEAQLLELAEAVEGPLAARGRWGAWREVLDRQLELARTTSNVASEARALHQLGSRALCLDDGDAAAVLLGQALSLRNRIGDDAGIRVTSHNLDVLRGPPPDGGDDGPPRSGRAGRGPRYWGTVAALSAVAAGGAAVAVVALSGDDDAPPPRTTRKQPPIVPGRLAVPARVGFAAQPVGKASAAVTITARNVGKAPVRVGSVEMLGQDRREFLVRSNACGGVNGTRLAPREHCDVTVAFKPLVAEGRTAQLVFRLADGDTQVVALSGDGVARVTPGKAVAAQIIPEKVALSTFVERPSSGQFTVTNIGFVPLRIGTIALQENTPSDFVLDASGCANRELAAAARGATAPAAGSTCTVTVTFTPTRAGLRAACPPKAHVSQAETTPTFNEPEPEAELPCTEHGGVLFADAGTSQSMTMPISGTAEAAPLVNPK